MPRHTHTKLVPPKTEPENQAIETLEEFSEPEPGLAELDVEIECPRCH
jgi:hypothetical protein